MVVVVVGKEQPTDLATRGPGSANVWSREFKNHLSHCLESSPGELNKIQNSIGGDSVHIIQYQLVSVGVHWTSIGLSAVDRLFLVDFDCWSGNIPADSPAGKSIRLMSPASMHRKVTGQLQQLQS